MQSRTLGAVVVTLLARSLAPAACSSGGVAPPVNIRNEGGVIPPIPLPIDGAVIDSGVDSSVPADAADAADADGATPNPCENKVKDGEETDVDCGGSRCQKCLDGKNCIGNADCAGNSCNAQKKCVTPTCVDNIKNGAETDVDCGGGVCRPCPIGRNCTTDTDCGSNSCIGTTTKQCECPKRTVIVSRSLGGAYCVDETEVTLSDYDNFIKANVSIASQDAGCAPVAGGPANNDRFIPVSAWPPTIQTQGIPVRHVDWCDAVAYCKWKGRSLCGGVDGRPGTVAGANDYLRDAWYNACSAQGSNTFSYGGGFRPGACVVDNVLPGPKAVCKFSADGSGTYVGIPTDPADTELPNARTCYGGFTGLFHMMGNVAEWTDVCDASGCLARGGDFRSSPANSSCTAHETVPKLTRRDDIGFRCCLY